MKPKMVGTVNALTPSKAILQMAGKELPVVVAYDGTTLHLMLRLVEAGALPGDKVREGGRVRRVVDHGGPKDKRLMSKNGQSWWLSES